MTLDLKGKQNIKEILAICAAAGVVLAVLFFNKAAPIKEFINKQDISAAVPVPDILATSQDPYTRIEGLVPFDITPEQARATLFSVMKNNWGKIHNKKDFQVCLSPGLSFQVLGVYAAVAKYEKGNLEITTVPTDKQLLEYNKASTAASALQRPDKKTFERWVAVKERLEAAKEKSNYQASDKELLPHVAAATGLSANEVKNNLSRLSAYYRPPFGYQQEFISVE
jgi:hypothetical protein